jgi:hypothetical protein
MRDDPRYGITATVVLAENLREKPPDGDLRSEYAASKLDLMIVENRLDTRPGKHLGERQTIVVCKPSAQFVQCRHNSVLCFVVWPESNPPGGLWANQPWFDGSVSTAASRAFCWNDSQRVRVVGLASELHTSGSERRTPS